VDFGWPDARASSSTRGRGTETQDVARDRRRLNALRAAGWTVVLVTAADLHDRIRLVAGLAATLGAPRYA
jgi:hypothetical protein